MTLISKTIFPRFNVPITELDLAKFYTPSYHELEFAKKEVKGDVNAYVFLVCLKIYQNLKYLPDKSAFPKEIINHLKQFNKINEKHKIEFKDRSIRRYRNAIRSYLNVISDRNNIRSLVINTVNEYAPILENSADIFNSVVEVLLKNNCELPSFRALNRLINERRSMIDNNIFELVSNNLNILDKEILDDMLIVGNDKFSKFNYIKELPKSPTLSHIKVVKENYIYLKNINTYQYLIDSIPPAKINNFASQLNVLDASEVRRFSDDKRYTLMICFIYKSFLKTGDDLITMFIKRLGKIHTNSKNSLEKLVEKQRSKSEHVVDIFHELLAKSKDWSTSDFDGNFNFMIEQNGGYDNLLSDCTEITAYHDNNYYPLLPKSFKSHRSTLFDVIKLLPIRSSNKDNSLMDAIEYLLSCENKKSDFIDASIGLSFANEKWRKFVITKDNNIEVFMRKHFEICVFSYIASEFKTGDVCADFSEEYADYRMQLLPWNECKSLLNKYCEEMELPNTPEIFIENLKCQLDEKARTVDNIYPINSDLNINPNGEIVLKKEKSTRNLTKIKEFKRMFESKMPERNTIEILCNIERYVNYTQYFGPLSGSDAKFSEAQSRYVLLTFGYGSNLGPTQTSKHVKGSITPHMIQFTNQRHITSEKLDKAISNIVNKFNELSLPKLWGDVDTVSADGTKLDLYSENLLSEYHIRYGGYGGIAYHHISDRYIALFSHFIPCGVWEAVYIIDGLLKNKSDIQPDKIHADTQGQSATVFALTHLLGIKLMPRIRNWKELKFYRPYKEASYNHIDSLFKDTVNWGIIETHYEDLFQVILSIKAGKILPSTLLRKLNNYSRKNKLFQAFRELGIVIRTIYLLEFISNIKLREKITESTNKTESYNAFSKWFFFGGEGVIRENDLDEQTKAIKYNDLLANAVILQNTIDIGNVVKSLKDDGVEISKQDIKNLSPYLTSHIKRFGEYIIDLEGESEPITNLDLETILE